MPNPEALRIFSRFSQYFQWVYPRQRNGNQRFNEKGVDRDAASKVFHYPKRLSNLVVIGFRALWLLAPYTLRIEVYCCLHFVGLRLYGNTGVMAQWLPFGLI